MSSPRPKSGYEAVYADMIRTPEGQAVLDTLRMWCGNAKIAEQSFHVDKDWDTGLARTRTNWKVKFGPVEIDFRDNVYTNFRLDFDRALDGYAAKNVVEAVFGKSVGTRNCQKFICLNGRERSKNDYTGEREIRSFGQALLEHASTHPALSRVKAEEESRIVGQMILVSESPQFAEARHHALCVAATKDVRDVLCKYRELPDEVLRDAIREAQVAGVIDF